MCQPLAASPPKKLCFAASLSVWNGCGSKARAKVLIASSSSVAAGHEALADGNVVKIKRRSHVMPLAESVAL